jgi:hypothetical protein
MLSRHADLISALTSLPESELAAVVAVALETRAPEAGRPVCKEGHARLPDAAAGRDVRATSEAGCCGLSFTSRAGQVICPLCGKAARAAARSPDQAGCASRARPGTIGRPSC